MKKFFEEFKAFISKGNVVDMAVGVIIATAFNKIVTSLVNDVVMPLVGILVGGLNVSDWKWVISEAVIDKTGVVVTAENALRYGMFIQNVIDFLIVAFSIFVTLKIMMSFKDGMGKLKKNKKGEVVEEAPAEPEVPAPTEVEILAEIRDMLKERK